MPDHVYKTIELVGSSTSSIVLYTWSVMKASEKEVVKREVSPAWYTGHSGGR